MRRARRSRRRAGTKPKIVLAVTSDLSLTLLNGVPDDLLSRGWDVTVLSSDGPRLRALQGAGFPAAVVPMERDPHPARDARALARWILTLLRLRPDVVVSGTPKAGLLGMLAAFVTRVPARIYLVRGLRLETTKGLSRRLLLLLEQVAAAAATHVVPVSASLRDVLLEERIGSVAKMHVVGSGSSNGVPIPERSGADLTRPKPGSPVIGFVGRPSDDKGLDLLLQALAVLIEQSIHGTFVHVGGGLSAVDEARLEDLRSGGWIIEALGELPDVSGVYARLDVLCLPSKREGFPNVVLEAAAVGVPTVATEATGISDAIVDGVTGVIVKQRDPQVLASVLQQLFDNRGRLHELGCAARRRAEQEFDRDLVQQRYAELYRRALDEVSVLP